MTLRATSLASIGILASVFSLSVAVSSQTAPPPEPAPVLSPGDEMKTFILQPGYHVELVASEPMIEEPIAIDFDSSGRLWVIELLGYMQDLPGSREREPIGRVSVLEDTDNDGTMDEKTVFLDHLVLPRALKVLEHGVLVAEPPNLWLARDTNGDLRSDSKDLVTGTFGRLDANVEHNANSLTWAMDNWMHTSEADLFLRLKNGAFDVRKTLSRGQWGNSQDDLGRIFRNSNESVLHVDIVPTPYFARNPTLVRTRGSYESLRGDKDENMTVWPAHPTRGVNRGYQTGVLRPDGTLAAFTSAAAPTVYRGDRLPAELRGNVFVVEPAANLISRLIVTDTGDRLRARRAYDRAEFMASTDERFRPVYLANAPDGTLYVVDMYHGIIQHRGYITEYLRDQILERKLDTPNGHGRIYRIVHDTTQRDRRPALGRESSARLVERLEHPNGWWRDTAQRILVERSDTSIAGALRKLADTAKEPRTRLHALWTLDGIGAIDPPTVQRALKDSSRDVRASAIRIAEQWFGDATQPIQNAVLEHMTDPDPIVRRQLAASIGNMATATKESVLATLLERYGDDPMTVDSALSGLSGSEIAILGTLLKKNADTPQVASAVTMVAATIVRGAQDTPVQQVFQWIAEPARPAWQRSALLRGAEVTLLSAVMPGGGGGRRGAGATGNTEPGARGGPGGAPAFPNPNGQRGGSAGGGRGAARVTLKLQREPALTSVTSSDQTDLGQRVTAVLARVEWPGKPGITAAAPLTAGEQQRFAAGREVYQSLCAACHQPDGRGRDNVAPSLIGSDFALATAGVPARIVLNGKEGTTGLMPPLGTVLSDDQIAAVLTYIRREWGHAASAVDVSTVKEVRTLTAGRARPWTPDELSTLIK
jgi:mono/diheme cytochrome c family protein/glucose/arabinose dehydrogenase